MSDSQQWNVQSRPDIVRSSFVSVLIFFQLLLRKLFAFRKDKEFFQISRIHVESRGWIIDTYHSYDSRQYRSYVKDKFTSFDWLRRSTIIR